MANLTSIDVTAGIPTAGTGTVATINALQADGGLVTLGAKADAKSTATDTTAITLMQVAKQISASAQLIATALGSTALDLGVGTAGSRTLRAAIDSSQVPTLGQAAMAASVPMAIASNQTLQGVIAPGLNSRVSVTRPSDTSTYGARDVVGVTGGGTASITFALAAVSASNIMITSARLQRNATAVISGETTYELHFFNVAQPGAQIDNAVFDVAAGDQASYLGYITFPALSDLGSTLHSNLENINKQVKLAGTSIFGVLVTVGGYTPVSAAVHVVDISAVQL